MSPQCPHCKAIFDLEQCEKIEPELCKYHIQDYVAEKTHRWVRTSAAYLGVLVILGGFTGFIALRDVILAEVAKRFAEEEVQKTLISVAESQAKQIISDRVEPHVKWAQEEIRKSEESIAKSKDDFTVMYKTLLEEIQSEIKTVRSDTEKQSKDFQSYLVKSEQDFNNKYQTLAEQVEILNQRNNLMVFADVAIALGDTEAFGELKQFKSDNAALRLAAIAQMFYVKSFYIGVSRYIGTSLDYTDAEGKVVTEAQIPTENLIHGAQVSTDWQIRAKSVDVLGTRKEQQVPDILLRIAEIDTRLDVRKCAIASFGRITGYQSPDVLEAGNSKDWWEKNKEDVLKKLKP